ncbi:MAG: AbrB/MazE/SpoVT family DNA-binding domain-containing protein [Schwartzia sp.]|nr:AbrB/MazE/SpoVT family DNA-binding domain-containing protein [Schwartzia sp. (in: firmicutes)]
MNEENDKMNIDIVTVSAKGQVTLPMDMRRALSVYEGSKLAVYATDKVIVLKPLELPTEKQFSKWLRDVQNWAKKAGYKEDDMSGIMKAVRSRKRK